MTTNIFNGGAINPYQLSAFGLLRTTGAPWLLADLINKYGLDAEYWGTAVTGTGSISNALVLSAVLAQAGGAVGTALIRNDEYWRYQAGKGIRWFMTGFSTDIGNVENPRRWGQFDANDGIYFQHSRPTVGNHFDLVIRSSSGFGGITVPQTSWNRFIYPTLDPTKDNIYEVSYQWLGAGAVYFWINGVLVHVEEHVNQNAGPYMRTAQLPMSVEVTHTGVGGVAGGWYSVCTSISVDGGSDPALWGYAYCHPGAPFAFSTTETPLVSIRPAATIAGIPNRTLLLPCHATLTADVFGGGSHTATFKTYRNATLGASAAWTAVGGASHTERDIGATSVGFVAGTLLDVTVLTPTQTLAVVDLRELFSIHGRKLLVRDLKTPNLDSLTITCQIDSLTVTGSINLGWQET